MSESKTRYLATTPVFPFLAIVTSAGVDPLLMLSGTSANPPSISSSADILLGQRQVPHPEVLFRLEATHNVVLKWLQDFSDRVGERAKGAAVEVNGLLDDVAALELDMKMAVLSFDNLTRQRFTEHASRVMEEPPFLSADTVASNAESFR
ncbi:hypothetical protein EJB05_11782, partial [Eragrostis curvula]